MWDEQDHFSRWIQGLSAIILSFIAAIGTYMTLHAPLSMLACSGAGATFSCAYIAFRCARYALTGRNNINRDNF